MRRDTRNFDHEEVTERGFIDLDDPDYEEDDLNDVEIGDYDEFEDEESELLSCKERKDQEIRFYSTVFACCAVVAGVVYLIARFIAYPCLKKVVSYFDE